MSMRLPSASDFLHYMDEVSACATVEDVDQLDWLSNDIRCVASYGNGEDTLWVTLLIDKNDSSVHFHVEISRTEPEYPRERVAIEEVRDLIDRFVGRTANARVATSYCIPRSELPVRGIIASLLTVGGRLISLTGAKLAVNADPVKNITWELRDSETVYATVMAAITTNIDSDYLRTCMTATISALATLILGHPSSDNA